MHIGVIGLGAMGENLILNLEEKGFAVSIFNRTSSKTRGFHTKHCTKNIRDFYDIESFVTSLESPKIILLMVTAGPPVDKVLESLLPHLTPEDIVMDGGNSFFEDTERRSAQYEGKFRFLGCGISGGEEGARHGPSIMVGGDPDAWKIVEEILVKIAACAGDKSCCAYFGPGGAGHFIKMVHNGIEYCEMEVLAEAYMLLKMSGLANMDIGKVLASWLENRFLRGYLLEIASEILRRDDNIVDSIEDRATQKGTGLQCVVTGMHCGVPLTSMADAVFARIISSRKELRNAFSSRVKVKRRGGDSLCLGDLEKSVIMAKSVAYVQGFNLLAEFSAQRGWDIDLRSVCDVWKNGCILRSDFLNVMEKMVCETGGSFELSAPFAMIYNENYEALKRMTMLGAELEIPVSALSSSLFYINGIKTARGGGNLIQAMRDRFGGHTVKLLGKEENVHIEWSS